MHVGALIKTLYIIFFAQKKNIHTNLRLHYNYVSFVCVCVCVVILKS